MALRWNDERRTLALSPRDLLDLGRVDLVGSRPPSAPLALSRAGRLARGRALHREAEDTYDEAEVTLRWSTVVRGWTVTVHARLDGLWRGEEATLVEELKSTALDGGALESAPAEAFAAWLDQLALYVTFAVEARLPAPSGVLRIVSLVDGASRSLPVAHDPQLVADLHARLDREIWQREDWLAWQGRRRAAHYAFPFPTLRAGQEEIVATARRTIEEGRHLLLVAPTGLGKTAAILHAALQVAARRGWGVYWATARTTQQEPVQRALAAVDAPLRAVLLRAKEKACRRLAEGEPLDCVSCPYAIGYRRRVVDALGQLPDLALPPSVDATARGAEICPYELAVDRGRHADVVVGDYNLAFDPDSTLHSLFGERDWVYVVDEAHHLPERLAQAASPMLALANVDAASAEVAPWPVLTDLAAELRSEIVDAGLRAADQAVFERPPEGALVPDELVVDLSRARWRDLADRFDEVALDHARLQRTQADPPGTAWIDLARAVHRFAGALDRAGEETLALWGERGLRLVCRDPARVLRPSFEAARASVLMSATLSPTWWIRDRCGLDADRTDELLVPSPFPPEHRRVVTVPGVSTAWRDREAHRPKIATTIDAIVQATPGNVAVYLGSYEALRDLDARCELPGHTRLVQSAELDDEGRRALLATLATPGPHVLLAVLGGSFAEGIDLPPGALDVVVVVGPAIPPPSLDRILLQQWYEDRYDAGFELAWIVPGMTKVVQAAGRLVRRPEDRGVIVLLCRRFLRTEHARHLPADWTVEKSSRPHEVVRSFFDG